MYNHLFGKKFHHGTWRLVIFVEVLESVSPRSIYVQNALNNSGLISRKFLVSCKPCTLEWHQYLWYMRNNHADGRFKSSVFGGCTVFRWKQLCCTVSSQVTIRNWLTLHPTLPNALSLHHHGTPHFGCGIFVSRSIPSRYSRATQSEYCFSFLLWMKLFHIQEVNHFCGLPVFCPSNFQYYTKKQALISYSSSSTIFPLPRNL